MTPFVRSRALVALLASAAAASCGDRGDIGATTDDQQFDAPAPLSADVASLAPDSVLALAMDQYHSSQLDSAVVLLQAASARAIEEEDVSTRADALTWLGNAMRRLGDYETSRGVGEEALELKLGAGLTDELWRSYNALGLLAYWESRLTDAIDLYDEALLAAQESADADPLAVAKIANNRGLVHFDLGNFPEAAAGFAALRDAGEASADSLEFGEGLANLGMLDIALGDPRAAIPRLDEARSVFAGQKRAGHEQVVLGHLGSAYLLLGDAGRARAAYDTALTVSREAGLRAEEAQNLELLASFFTLAGDHQRALRYYADAKEINSGLGDDMYAGIDLRNEAVSYVALGELAVARQRALQALQLHEPLGALVEELRDRLVLAEIAGLQGDSVEVARQIDAAQNLADDLGTTTHGLEVALTRARLADETGDSQGVLTALAQIGRTDYSTEWEVESLRSRALLRLDDLAGAIEAGRRAVEAMERVRGSLGSGVLRTSFSTARSRTYSDLVTALLRTGAQDEAFVISDAARGRGLVEHLSASGAGTTDELTRGVEEGRRILERIARLSAALAGNAWDLPPAEANADLTELLRDARAEYDDHLLRLAETDPRRAVALGLEHIDLADVQASLTDGQVLLEYLVTPDRVVTFVVTKAGVETVESQISESNLSSRIRVTRGMLSQPDMRPEDVEVMLEELYDLLFEPAARSIGLQQASELIIVPHGVLTYLAFGTLRDRVTDRYLAERFAISFVPSAGALPLLRQDGSSVSERVLAGGANVLAPAPDRLPATRTEAEAIEATLSSATLRLGSEATEAVARASLDEDRAFHVAGHASLTPENPLFSWIEMAEGGSSEVSDDGRLEIHEVLQLSIESPLVFLSGCETGVGQRAWSNRFVQGEDLATLAQAFLYAGAESVVATLWRVEDRGAAAFAAEFYRALATGATTPAEALAVAQRAMLVSERFSSPYHWAGYRVNG